MELVSGCSVNWAGKSDNLVPKLILFPNNSIEQRAKREGAEIAWGDESGLRSDAQVGRGYAPIGETPEIHLSQKKRVRVNFIASLSNQGNVRFRLYTALLHDSKEGRGWLR